MADFAPTYMDLYDQDQADVAVLEDLTLDVSEIEVGDVAVGAVIGAIEGADANGVLSLPYDNGTFGIDSGNLVIGPNGGELAEGTYTVVILENATYASNTPHATTLTVTVAPDTP